MEILPVGRKKSKIVLDDGTVFALYNSEVRRLGLETGKEMDEAKKKYIFSELLPERCKNRALYILQKSDRTQRQLRQKLADGFFPSAVIETVMSFLAGYGYVDDYSFCMNYIDINRRRYGRRVLEMKLMQRGADRELIRECLKTSFSDGDDEGELIEMWIKKKNFDVKTADLKEKNKMTAFLLRKGFKYDKIMEIIK